MAAGPLRVENGYHDTNVEAVALAKHMTVDPDGRAVRFGLADRSALTAALCAALRAQREDRQTILWVERVDLASVEGPVVLFHDEDGTSHLELPELDASARQRVFALLEAAGFTR